LGPTTPRHKGNWWQCQDGWLHMGPSTHPTPTPNPPTPPPTPLVLGPALLAAAYSVQSQPPPRIAGPGGVGAGWGGCTLARTRRADQPPAPNPPTYTTGCWACPPGCSILSAMQTPTQDCRARWSGGWVGWLHLGPYAPRGPTPSPQPPHLHHWLCGLPSWLQHTQCNANPHPGLQGQVEWGLGL
jgi:hypothetical protein